VKVNTNTIEGYYSIFKRGTKGVYQHCSEKHLHRYLAEFDFRYSNRSALGCEDMERADRMALGIVGKRLTYRRTNEAHARQAGLKGTVVPVWESGGRMNFIASQPWHPFFRRLSMDRILNNLNKELSG
jgi:hypothetical protein